MILALAVDTEPGGGLVVSWEVGGHGTAVDVGIGATPDPQTHVRCASVPAGTTTVTLPDPPHPRPFVSVREAHEGHGPARALVAADRRVPLHGACNFRDLGGYPTRRGGCVRWGRVFRSDSLHKLSTDDLEAYGQLGVRSVFDLRGDAERSSRPNVVPSTPLPLTGPTTGAPPAATTGEQFLCEVYVGLVAEGAPLIGQLFTAMAAATGLPSVFHCHAGKDRTGVVAALLLELLGVPRRVVLDDYELTSRYRVPSDREASYRNLLRLGLSPEAAASVVGTSRSAMARTLDALDQRYGGIDRYLTGPAGMAPADLEALRRLLVAPAP